MYVLQTASLSYIGETFANWEDDSPNSSPIIKRSTYYVFPT